MNNDNNKNKTNETNDNNKTNETNETLNSILTQLSSINSKIKNLERRIILDESYSILSFIEQHAKECTDFKEFTIYSPKPPSNSSAYQSYQQTTNIMCNCNFQIVMCNDNKIIIPIIQEFIDELKIKYKKEKTQIITNITSRIEI